jgi:hypothetical protein
LTLREASASATLRREIRRLRAEEWSEFVLRVCSRSLVLTAAALVVASGAVRGQGLDRYLLSDSEYRSLPSGAQEHYNLGVNALDHIDYVEGYRQYRLAAEAAADSPVMQFKLVELSRRQARLSGSRRAEDFLVVALEALQRVVDSPASTPDDQRRAARLVEVVETRLEQAPITQQQRHAIGRDFIHALTLERDWTQAGREASDMERAVVIESGPGGFLARSSVVLIDSGGHLYNPDKTPFLRSGQHATRVDMAGATFETQPDADFFQGVSPTVGTSIPEPSEVGVFFPPSPAPTPEEQAAPEMSFDEPIASLAPPTEPPQATAPGLEEDFSGFFAETPETPMAPAPFGGTDSVDAEVADPFGISSGDMSEDESIQMGITLDFENLSAEDRAEMASLFAEMGIEDDPTSMSEEEFQAAAQQAVGMMFSGSMETALAQARAEIEAQDISELTEEDFEEMRAIFSQMGIEGDPATMSEEELKANLLTVTEAMFQGLMGAEMEMEAEIEAEEPAASEFVDPFADL